MFMTNKFDFLLWEDERNSQNPYLTDSLCSIVEAANMAIFLVPCYPPNCSPMCPLSLRQHCCWSSVSPPLPVLHPSRCHSFIPKYASSSVQMSACSSHLLTNQCLYNSLFLLIIIICVPWPTITTHASARLFTCPPTWQLTISSAWLILSKLVQSIVDYCCVPQ